MKTKKAPAYYWTLWDSTFGEPLEELRQCASVEQCEEAIRDAMQTDPGCEFVILVPLRSFRSPLRIQRTDYLPEGDHE